MTETTQTNFFRDLKNSYSFGATEGGGVDRQAGTEDHASIRRWFIQRCTEEGMRIDIDAVGNIYATFEWVSPHAASIYVGSHLDSQPRGGRFDGTYGVVAGLHAAIALNSKVRAGQLIPRYNLTVTDWFNEEGARFTPSIMGSSVMAGILPLQDALNSTDPNGVSVREALEATGFNGTASPPKIHAYSEIHIEQGRKLDRANTKIGLVTGSWFTQKLEVQILGEQSHTGATLMEDRRDALPAAAEVILLAEELPRKFPAESIVTSIGKIHVEPNSPIVVSREVNLTIDLRSASKEQVLKSRDLLLRSFADIATRRGIEIIAADFDVRETQLFPQLGIDIAESTTADLHVPSLRLETMAGHDAIAMNRIVPALLLFVPSENGVSHCEKEFTADADLEIGLLVLENTVQRLLLGALEGEEG
ncbi:Putative hydrolase [Corynebacterium kalinowskii]|uniref:Hydrolase n=1 Tax=Corynebacterium kalinowskii TaxID=2675216 RepID=A0A6B8VBI7_9CORY|nr:M20 family metallo-hydrolase [Corynebacterium kalinowskii]QGU01533.1 Putative hydrolase [Corynebacterium kalinowskii]